MTVVSWFERMAVTGVLYGIPCAHRLRYSESRVTCERCTLVITVQPKRKP